MNDRVHHPLALEFHRARLGAMRASIDELIRSRPPSLLAENDSWAYQPLRTRLASALKSVPIYRIISRTSRYDDVTLLLAAAGHHWQPRRSEDRTRAVAPPISLYHVGEDYFVQDGNRRVTEARARGQLFLLARVTEYRIDTPLDDSHEVIAQLLLDEHHEFEAATALSQLRPAARVACSALGGYSEILHTIEAYRAELEASHNGPVERYIAVTSWYDTIYAPIVAAIRSQGLLDVLPGRSEADLYLWVSSWHLRQEARVLRVEGRHSERIAALMQVIAGLR